jgi:hypothetical protein
MMPMPAIREVVAVVPGVLPLALLQSSEPVVLRGLIGHWPAVQAGQHSAAAASAYLKQHYRGASVGAWRAAPEIAGRFFYNEDFSGFNFRPELRKLDELLDELLTQAASPRPASIYVGSTTVDTCLPGFRAQNDLGFGVHDPLMSIWIGNRTRIAAHHDLPDNLACVAAGHRRFTLFPPEQLSNLYIGPLDLTPAGQPISLVDFAQPDFHRFPRFAEALRHAQSAELGPGDALFIPSMWWHHVEALDALNVLVNYWWRQSPDFMDAPINALMLALLSVRELPIAQREAWQEMFRHYVFEADASTAAHIPPAARGLLSPLSEQTARVLRAKLLKKMNR